MRPPAAGGDNLIPPLPSKEVLRIAEGFVSLIIVLCSSSSSSSNGSGRVAVLMMVVVVVVVVLVVFEAVFHAVAERAISLF